MQPMQSSRIFEDIIAAYRKQLVAFLKGPERSRHLAAGPVKSYLRKGVRCVGGAMVKTLDLASIDIDPAARHQGLGGRILALIEDENPFECVFVESVLNKDFADFLARRGYAIRRQDPAIDIPVDATLLRKPPAAPRPEM